MHDRLYISSHTTSPPAPTSPTPAAPHQAQERLQGPPAPKEATRHTDQVEADFCPASHGLTQGLARAYQDPEAVDAHHPWDNTANTLRGATNAHVTNSQEEMDRALRQKTDWLEGDMHPGQHLRMGHDGPTGISFDQWLQQGMQSGRGLKLEIKEPPSDPHNPKDVASMTHILDEIDRNGVPGKRMMFNMNAHAMEGFGPLIHERLPEAILTISGSTPKLNVDQLARTAQSLRDAGVDPHFLNFSIRDDQADAGTVARLKEFGSVSIWNDPKLQLPWDSSLQEREDELRRRGVDGIIDLRSLHPDELLSQGLRLAEDEAKKGLRRVEDEAKKGLHQVEDLGKKGLGAVKDGAGGLVDLGKDLLGL